MNTPKFKKGDWIKRKEDGHIARIVMLLKTCYDLELTNGECWWLDYDFQDNWELTDAPPKTKLEEAAEAYQQQVIEETKNHIHLPQHTYAEGFEDALHLISDAFIAGWKYRSECEESSIMGDLLKNILKVGVQHNFGFGPDLKQCKDNEDESK